MEKVKLTASMAPSRLSQRIVDLTDSAGREWNELEGLHNQIGHLAAAFRQLSRSVRAVDWTIRM